MKLKSWGSSTYAIYIVITSKKQDSGKENKNANKRLFGSLIFFQPSSSNFVASFLFVCGSFFVNFNNSSPFPIQIVNSVNSNLSFYFFHSTIIPRAWKYLIFHAESYQRYFRRDFPVEKSRIVKEWRKEFHGTARNFAI